MLEVGPALQTWALRRVPIDWQSLDLSQELLAASNSVEAERIADHRLAYLEYEGPVRGDRGHVRRLDAGEYRVGATATRYSLDGQTIRGEIEIAPLHGTSGACQLTYRSARPLTDS